jgi:16S rRNA processing protein RimM
MSLCKLAAITGVHGLQGWFKVKLFSDHPDRFKLLETVLVGKTERIAKEMHVEDSREDHLPVRLKFKEISDRTAAERLIGHSIFITDEQMLPPPEGTHYVHDLIGCEAFNAESGKLLGIVQDVLLIAANDVYVIEDESGAEVLVPARPEFVKEVDIEQKRIIIIPYPGLIPEDDEN